MSGKTCETCAYWYCFTKYGTDYSGFCTAHNDTKPSAYINRDSPRDRTVFFYPCTFKGYSCPKWSAPDELLPALRKLKEQVQRAWDNGYEDAFEEFNPHDYIDKYRCSPNIGGTYDPEVQGNYLFPVED
jgi:hypothetical protein